MDRDLVAGQRPVDPLERERRRDVDRDDLRVRVRRADEVDVARAVPLMSSKKTPWPWTSRLSSLRGIDVPIEPLLQLARLRRRPASSSRRLASVLTAFTDGDRLDDVLVAGAAADVPLDRRPRLVLARASDSPRAAPSRSSASRACSSRTGARGGRRTPAAAAFSSSSSARPSTVSIFAPSAWTASSMQLFTATPSRWIVQAPQLPVSQPMCVPGQLEVVADEVDEQPAGSTSRSYSSPLTSTEIDALVDGSVTSRPSRSPAGRRGRRTPRRGDGGSRRSRGRRTADRAARRATAARTRVRRRFPPASTSTGTASTQPSAIRAPPSPRQRRGADDAGAVAPDRHRVEAVGCVGRGRNRDRRRAARPPPTAVM